MLNESLKKIKGLMYYDKSLTATENKEKIQEQLLAPAAAAAYGGKKLIDRYRQKNKVDVRPGEIARAVKNLHKNMEGRLLRSNGGEMTNSLNQIKTLSGRKINGEDAVEVVKGEYKRLYGTDLVADITKKGEKVNYKGITKQKELLSLLGGGGAQPTNEPTKDPVAKTASYVPCQGGINKFGCKSDSIAKIQQAAGLKADGMFGKKTQAKLSQVAPEFSKQFSDTDVPAIIAKLTPAKNDVETPNPVANIDSPKPITANIDTSKIGSMSPTSAPKANTIPRPGQQNESDPKVKEDMFKKPEIKPGGYKMAQGFVNESLNNKDQWRKNKQERLDRKFGRIK